MHPINSFLDHHVAHNLSQLTECGAQELPSGGHPWLERLAFAAFFLHLPAQDRAYRINFLRRIEGAIAAYEMARESLLEYLRTPACTISPYFRSLVQFEVCISQIYQALEMLRCASGREFFGTADSGEGDRLHRMYGDSHHMEHRIADGDLPLEATSAIWITNAGLESSHSSVPFTELKDWLVEAMAVAEEMTRTCAPGAQSTREAGQDD